MSEDRCQANGPTKILDWAGDSNVEQLSNIASVELFQEGFSKLLGIADIVAKLDRFIESLGNIPELVLVDGEKHRKAQESVVI